MVTKKKLVDGVQVIFKSLFESIMTSGISDVDGKIIPKREKLPPARWFFF